MISIRDLFRTRKSINLLPKGGFESSLAGQILNWSLNVGKWIVVATQLVVVSVFLMRFSLDRKLTDLHSQIKREVSRIKSYESIEDEFRKTQKMLKFVKPIVVKQKLTVSVIDYLLSIMPPDMWVENISIGSGGVQMMIDVGSINSLARFVNALKTGDVLSNVSIQNIESTKGQLSRFRFNLDAKIVGLEEKK